MTFGGYKGREVSAVPVTYFKWVVMAAAGVQILYRDHEDSQNRHVMLGTDDPAVAADYGFDEASDVEDEDEGGE